MSAKNSTSSNANVQAQTRKRRSFSVGIVLLASFHMGLTQAFQPPSLPSRSAQRHSDLAYSTAADPPVSSSASFAERMRALGIKQVSSQNSKKTSVTKKPQLLSNMYQASSKEECQAIAQEKMDRVTVFRFFAPWCRACKKIAPRFDKMARDHPGINFVQIPYNDQSRDFIQKLGIPSLPYGAVFDPNVGLIEQVNINPNKFEAFEKIVNSYDSGECELSEEMMNEDGIYSAPYARYV